MFFFTNLFLALSLISLLLLVAPIDAAPTARGARKCSVKVKGSSAAGGGPAINVGADPSGSAPAVAKPSDTPKPKPSGCFPSAGFNTPDGKPDVSLGDWWCSRSSEYAFMGFSYGVDGCPSKSDMTRDFKNMKNSFKARYVRIYAACDRDSFNDDMVEAAYDAGIGIFALVWFGFDGSDIYKTRMSKLISTIKNNDLAPYVIRNIAIGSEAMFDHALSPDQLASTIRSVQGQVSKYGIEVSTSDMSMEWTQNPNVISAAAHIESNTLPFFSGSASWGANGINDVLNDINTYKSHASGKKIYMTQIGWPSNQNVWHANSASAVASVASEKAFFDALDDKCSTFKSGPKGGVGWFAHIYSDQSLSGWGITSNGNPKFDFSPRTHC